MASRGALSRTQSAAASAVAADAVRHDDVRLTDARTPTAHASSHMPGGSDFVFTAWRTVSAATTLLGTDELVLADTSSAAFTITLPTAVGRGGQTFLIKKIGVNGLTIATTSSQTIDGLTTELLSVTGGFREVISDGANWRVIGGKVDPVIAALSDVAGGGTLSINASQAGVYRVRLTGSTATLAVPTQPVDGDVINIEAYATTACSLTVNASIILTSGITSPISIGSGKLWSAALRYRAATSPVTSAAAWRLLASSVDN